MALTTDTDGGAALWCEVNQWSASPQQMLKWLPTGLKTFVRHSIQAMKFLSQFEKNHLTAPHRSLQFIGAHTNYRAQGHRGRLIQKILNRCDRHGVAADLADTNPTNGGFYQRFRFRWQGPLPLPNGAPLVTAMWRVPRP